MKKKCIDSGCKILLETFNEFDIVRCEKHRKQYQEEIAQISGTAEWAAENPELVD